MYLKILFILVLISNTMYAKSSWVPISVSDIVIFIPNSQINKPLSISNIHPKNITKNSALIVWDVSKYATGQVEYGETIAYGHFHKEETSFNYKRHGQLLKDLKVGTTYHYRVISKDASGNKVISEDHTFTTLGALISVSNISPTNITKNSALIVWDVSKYATGQVEYGETSAYGHLHKKETSFDYNRHGQTLKNLKAGTTYHYRVISEDASGHKVVSEDYTFTTLENLNLIYPPDTILEGLKIDRVNRPNRPKKSESYTDNSFDDDVIRTVTRITNREEDYKNNYKQGGGMDDHPYPKHGTAWNNDMSLLRLNGRLYDANAKDLHEIELTKDKLSGKVYDMMKAPTSNTAGIRWSKEHPNVLYVMSHENKFLKLTLTDNNTKIEDELIYDFTKLGKGKFTIGHGEGNLDYNDRYVVLSATSGNSIYAVLLDIKAKHLVWGPKKMKYPVKTNGKSDFDWISISPSGKYILVSSNAYNRRKGSIDLHDALTFKLIKRLAKHSAHGDIGKTSNNEDIYVQWEYNKYYGYILNNNPNDEHPITLLDRSGGSAHVSCRNYTLKNWCYISSSNDGYREVFALKLDGSMKVRRFAKTHAKGPESGDDDSSYHTMPAGIPSPDGTKVLFWSDYGNPEDYLYKDNGQLTEHWDNRDTYQVEISK